MNLQRPLVIFILLILLIPEIALADNGVNVIKPFQSYGAYGDAPGQIDNPICVRMDAADNLYVLQDIGYKGKHRRVISVFDRNLTYVNTFDVVKTSMVDPGLDRAPYGRNLYYDNTASSMAIGDDGSIYVLSLWDVMVYDPNGAYRTQFPVSSFMTWIGSTGQETWFYYPSGILAGENGKVIVTSGNSPRHELITVGPDARLVSKSDLPAGTVTDMVKDSGGRVFMIVANQSAIRVYNRTMAPEKDLQLQYNGTYSSDPSSIAFFGDGNFTASANGVYLYYPNGSRITSFMDNNQTDADRNWGRLVAVNSSNFLIVVGGERDSKNTSQPILTYKYVNGTIVGEQKASTGSDLGGFCPGMFGPFYLAYLGVKAIYECI